MISTVLSIFFMFSSVSLIHAAFCSYTMSAGSTTVNYFFGTQGDCCEPTTGVALVTVYEEDNVIDEYYQSDLAVIQGAMGC